MDAHAAEYHLKEMNGPFPSSLVPLYQNESKCKTIHESESEFRLQVSFHANQSHFHENGFALRLVLIQRHKGTRKWPILFAVGKTTHISLSHRLVPVHCQEYQYNLSLLHHSISV